MPNKSANQIHTVFQPIFHPSVKFTALRSQLSVKYAFFFISSLLKFDRFSAIRALPRNWTCEMLMRWSAHLPKRGVTKCVKDTS